MLDANTVPAVVQILWAASAILTIVGMVFAFFFITWPFMKFSRRTMARMLEIAEMQVSGPASGSSSREEILKTVANQAYLVCTSCYENLGMTACEPERTGQVFRVLCGPCQVKRNG